MAEDGAAGIVVFAGPTLPATLDGEWQGLLDGVDLRPPVQRGDVLSALCLDPHTLLILDGYYYTVPSVTHKELLYALEAGTRVIGAASLGALRAAELAAFGMEGVGEVFRWFRDGVLDGDDEVAVLHGAADDGYRPLTLALVDVRATLAALVAAGELEEGAAAALIARQKALPFGERHAQAFAAHARELGLEIQLESRKQADAREALRLAREAPPPRRESRALPPGGSSATTFLGHFCEWHLRVPREAGEKGENFRPTFLAAWNLLRLFHPEAPRLVTGLRWRFLLASAASRLGLLPVEGRVEELATALFAALASHHGRILLPRPEIWAEATDQALAEAASTHCGGTFAAVAWLAESLGLARDSGVEKLFELLGVQDDLMPAWTLARSGACVSAFPAAARLARAADQIWRAFRHWAGAQQVAADEVLELAAEIWACPKEHVPAAAAARGLYDSRGFSPGLRAAVERVAAAERLPWPINDYPALKLELLALPLAYPFELPAPVAVAP